MLGVLGESSSHVVTGVTPADLDESTIAAWEQLDGDQSAPANPFLHPTWVMHWYEKYVSPADRMIMVVTRADSGAVVGIAPMHIHRLRIGPVPLATRLLPVGAGIGPNPLEIPGLLTAARSERDVARALVAAAMDAGTDWAEIALDPRQGWFEPEWMSQTGTNAHFDDYARPRSCVIMPIASTWEETRSGLKRNVKESIRRSGNRLKKDGRTFEVVRRGKDIDREVVERFLDLHSRRAQHGTSSSQHHDAFARAEHHAIMIDSLPELGLNERASIFELYLDSEVVAAQVALHARGTSYVHSSGFKPETWDLGVVTHLHGEVIRHAVERGDSVVNFSPGPNVSKLRWSEQLWIHHEFSFGSGPRSLHARFGAYQALTSIKAGLHNAARQRPSRSRSHRN